MTSHDDAEARGRAETFLRGRNNNIDAPIVESDLFARNSADAVEDNLSARRLQLDTLCTIHRLHTKVSGDTRRVSSPMCFAFDRTPKCRTGVTKRLKGEIMWRTGAGIDVGERHNLVFLSFQSPSIGGKFGVSSPSERVIPLQLRFSHCGAEGRYYLGYIRPVRF